MSAEDAHVRRNGRRSARLEAAAVALCSRSSSGAPASSSRRRRRRRPCLRSHGPSFRAASPTCLPALRSRHSFTSHCPSARTGRRQAGSDSPSRPAPWADACAGARCTLPRRCVSSLGTSRSLTAFCSSTSARAAHRPRTGRAQAAHRPRTGRAQAAANGDFVQNSPDGRALVDRAAVSGLPEATNYRL